MAQCRSKAHLRRGRAGLDALHAAGERGARGGQVARAQVLQALPHRLQQVGDRAPARAHPAAVRRDWHRYWRA